MRRNLYEPDHEAFREIVQAYITREVTPNQERWEAQRNVDRQAWQAAGKQAIIGHLIPERFGGLGTQDFRFRCVVMEELAKVAATSLGLGFGLQDDIALPYLIDLGTEEQKARWLPPTASGEHIGAIAMTEPSAGSDLQGIRTTAVRDVDSWLLNGAKTFITNGFNSDLVIVAARTSQDAGSRGISLLVVECGMPGFSHGRKLDKIGLVNRVADEGQALEEALGLAEKIAANGPLALIASKEISNGGSDWTAEERWDEMARVMRPVFTSQDAQEGARAFAEKRAPVWKGR